MTLASGKLILVVDDDQGMVEYWEMIDEKEGFRVATAKDGQEAMAKAQQCPPDLILIREGLALVGVRGTAASMARVARKAARSLVRGWASCLGRIFEVDVIKCARCGGTMKAIASIRDDVELERLLRHVGLEADFPKDAARSCAAGGVGWGGLPGGSDGGKMWDGKDAQPADD